MDYATFLCPSSADALRAFECVLQRFFQCCLGIRERQSRIPRLLLMFKIDTLGIRQRTTASAFVGRLMSILDDDHATEQQKLQAKKTQIALNTAEAFQRIVALATKPLTEDQIMSMKQIMRERISRNMRRPVPIWKKSPRATAEVCEAQSSSVSMAFRSVSCTQSLPAQYRPTHVPGWPEEMTSEESDKSGIEKRYESRY